MSQRFEPRQGGRNAKLTGHFDGDLFDGQRLLPLALLNWTEVRWHSRGWIDRPFFDV